MKIQLQIDGIPPVLATYFILFTFLFVAHFLPFSSSDDIDEYSYLTLMKCRDTSMQYLERSVTWKGVY